jgi:hypothetical protein
MAGHGGTGGTARGPTVISAISVVGRTDFIITVGTTIADTTMTDTGTADPVRGERCRLCEWRDCR